VPETAVAERIAALDAEWYSTVLRDGGHAEAAVTEVETEPLEVAGAAGDLARVRLSYEEDAAGPESLIAKIRGADELRAAMDAAMGLFAREARFYSEYANRVPIATPRCYFVGDGTETPLLIEDLGGLRMGDQSEGLSPGDAERIVGGLADLHAAYWGVPPDEEGFLASPGEGTYAAMIAQLVASGAPAVQERFADRIGAGVLAAIAKHAPNWGHVLERCAEGPPTFVHNDCRLDNVFFRSDGEPLLVDWQIPARTRGTADVSYLIGGSMDPDVAAERWEPLLRGYHEGLVAKGVDGYSWDQCVEHYRVSALYALGPGFGLLGSLAGRDEDRGAGEVMALRALRHVEDLDSFSALEAG
jgi:Ecdysteroid kinase-like family